MLLALVISLHAEAPVSVTTTKLDLTSAAFGAGAEIPRRHTCEGDDLSPALSWGAGPDGTRAWALVVDDPDAPGRTWVHWLAWDLPPTARGLPEGVAADAKDLVQGTNDFRKVGWGGPCPPKGHGAHRYVFHLYALDKPLGLPRGATRVELDRAMAGHVLATGELTGKFHR